MHKMLVKRKTNDKKNYRIKSVDKHAWDAVFHSSSSTMALKEIDWQTSTGGESYEHSWKASR